VVAALLGRSTAHHRTLRGALLTHLAFLEAPTPYMVYADRHWEASQELWKMRLRDWGRA
jgi:hypothetical protein